MVKQAGQAKKPTGVKLGNINNKPVYCGAKCNNCPLNRNSKVVVDYIKSGKRVKIVCKSKDQL